jgi:hypothetical protein
LSPAQFVAIVVIALSNKEVVVDRITRKALLPGAAMLLLLTSCVDLTDVTKFATASQKVGDNFAAIATDAPLSCQRANTFVTTDNPVPKLDCDWYTRMNPPLAVVNKALFDYIAALGKLSNADLSKVGSGLDSLSDDLKKRDPSISAGNLSKAGAIGGLVKAITELWANGYRERKLADIIKNYDAAVLDVTSFLRDYALYAFGENLRHELGYESSLCINKQSPKTEPVATYLLNKACDADAVPVNQKIAAVKAYQDALKTIQDTHRKLAQNTGKFDLDSLSKAFGSSASDLGNAASVIHKAF